MTATERLAEIKARAEAATEGPWECVPVEFSEQVGYSIKSHAGSVVLFGGYGPRGGTSEANALLAAHARTDVPQLVAALEAVLELHQPDAFTECGNCHTGQGEAHPYPCPTVEAITEALGGDQ